MLSGKKMITCFIIHLLYYTDLPAKIIILFFLKGLENNFFYHYE